MEPRAPQTCGGEAPTARSEFFTDSPRTPSAATHPQPLAGCHCAPGDLAARYDRRWLAVDETGAWLTPDATPRLAEIAATFRYGYLALQAPGMLRMDIPLEVEEDDDSVARTVRVGEQTIPVVDEGDLLAAWLSNFLERACRVVKRHPPDVPVAWPDRPTA